MRHPVALRRTAADPTKSRPPWPETGRAAWPWPPSTPLRRPSPSLRQSHPPPGSGRRRHRCRPQPPQSPHSASRRPTTHKRAPQPRSQQIRSGRSQICRPEMSPSWGRSSVGEVAQGGRRPRPPRHARAWGKGRAAAVIGCFAGSRRPPGRRRDGREQGKGGRRLGQGMSPGRPSRGRRGRETEFACLNSSLLSYCFLEKLF